MTFDTICAPATTGGAICVVRVSGTDALAVVDRTVTFRKNFHASTDAVGGTVRFGTVDGLDEVLVTFFRAPHSYTGEDCVEIGCHASQYIVQEMLRRLCDAGARMARPGEFTERAFLNGKMDLAQAEAVADLIASDTEAAHRIALGQLKGGYSAELRGLRGQLLELASLLELELDFSEEEVEFASRARLQSLLEEAVSHTERLAESFHAGNAIKNGIPVAIIGSANSGKSTLLNALLGEERAIVTDIAGTTRDTVEEKFVIGGQAFRFIDTAGLRSTEDAVERLGIERSRNAAANADIIIGVLDGLQPLEIVEKSAREILDLAGSANVIMVRNKVDAYDTIAPEEFSQFDRSYGIFPLNYPAFGTFNLSPEELGAKCGSDIIDISAKTGEGLETLKDRIVAFGFGGMVGEALGGAAIGGAARGAGATLVTNARHADALRRSAVALRAVRTALDAGVSGDLVAEDLRSAISALGEITGEITADEVLGEIFGRFCIGK